MIMKEFTYTITDEAGLHARPAGRLAKKASEYKSSVTVTKDGKKADTSRVMALMSMGIKYGDTINITIEGEDEEQAVNEIKQFMDENKL